MCVAITGCGEASFDADLDGVVNALESNALVHLPLNEGAGSIAADSSGNGNDGSLANGAAFEAGTGDGSAFAVRFDGVDDFIDLGPLDVSGTGLTLAVWFRADSFPGQYNDPRLISKATGTAANDHAFMLSTIRAGSKVRLRARVRVGGTTTTLIAASGDLAVDEWRHAAVTYDGATLRLYLDAVEVGSTPLSGPVDMAPSVPVTVGSQPPGAGPRFFEGLLDDVRILSRALGQSELDAILNPSGGPPVAGDDSYQTQEDIPLSVNDANGVLNNDSDPDSEPLQAVLVNGVSNGLLTLNPDGSFDYNPDEGFVGQDGFTYLANDSELDSNLAIVTISVSDTSDGDALVELPLDDGVGSVALDISGNGNDGVLVNGAAFEASAGDGSAFAVRFDGADDFVDLGGLDANGPGLTLSAWFNADSFPGSSKDPRLISKATGTSANAHVFMLSTIAAGSAIRLRARVRIGGTTTTLIASSGDLAAGEWRHAAVTYDGVTLRLYLDAVEVGSTPLSGIVDVAPAVPVTVGGQPPGAGPRFFDGLLDDVRILSRALSQSELAGILNQPNRAPVAQDDNYQTLEGTPLSVNAANGVLNNDTDPDSDLLQAVLVDDVSNGVLTLHPSGSFDYAPNAGFSGQDGFTYVAADTELDSGLAGVTISVSPVGTVNAQPRIVTGSVAFSKEVVDDTLGDTHAVAAADFTGDGHVDLVATDFLDSMVFWYENDGAGSFVTRVLDSSLGGAYPIGVGDVDGDGQVDVLAAGYNADTFVWYESDGSGGFTEHAVDTASNGAHSMVSGDLDDDGDFDLVTSSQDSNNISWYENDGANGFTRHVIDSSAVGAKRAEIGDVDGDGDQDVVTASFFSDEIAWHENDGNESFTKRIIDTTANGAYYVSPADVDGDGDLDVFSASQLDNTIAWYRNDGSSGFSYQPINTAASGARTVIAADINGDGHVDAVSASVNDDTVAWYENDGNGSFTGHLVDAGADGAYGLFAIDVNHDGLLDILSASRDARELAIHTNTRSHSITVDLGGTVIIDSALLRTEDTDDTPAELTYTITAIPVSGVLELGGAAVSTGHTFTQQDIDDGLLRYTHDGVDESWDTFDFTVADGGEDGTQPLLGRFSINVVGFTGPLVELPMNEGVGTTAGDVSGQGNDGALVNGAGFEANTGDGSAFAVRVDGVDDFVDLGALDVNGTGLTLSIVFNADSFPGPSSDPRLISKATGTQANQHVFMLGTVGVGSEVRLRARVRHAVVTTTLIASSGSLVTGAWYHAAMTYDGATCRLYLDGTEVGSSLFFGAVDIDPTIPVAVGAQPPGAGDRYFHGLLDDVRILSRAMSPSEIAQIAAGVNSQ